MASDRTAVKRTSMYACDYDHLDEMGYAPTFEDAPTSKELLFTEKVIGDCVMHMMQPNSAPIVQAEHKKTIEESWIFRFDSLCTEVKGIAASDMFFVARCFLLCCEKPRLKEKAVLNDIHELYSRLQYFGTNHTRKRFEEMDSHREMLELEERVSALVVFCLEPPEKMLEDMQDQPLPDIDDLLRAKLLPLRFVPENVKLTEEEKKKAAEKAEEEKQKMLRENTEVKHDEIVEEEEKLNGIEYDVNEGAYWHSDKNTILTEFVPFASRILRNYWLHKTIFDKYPLVSAQEMPTPYSDHVKECFLEWVQRTCIVEAGDDGTARFQEFVYRHWLPEGSSQVMLRSMQSKYEMMAPLNLLENQLGVDSATALANMTRIQTKLIIKDETHDAYGLLILSQFIYLFKHATTSSSRPDGIDFVKWYYIQAGDLAKWVKRLDCKKTWGIPRRPIFTRICRMWAIHDAGKWIPCESELDLVLKFITVLKEKYNCQFADGADISHWIETITTKRNEDDYN